MSTLVTNLVDFASIMFSVGFSSCRRTARDMKVELAGSGAHSLFQLLYHYCARDAHHAVTIYTKSHPHLANVGLPPVVQSPAIQVYGHE